MVAAQNQSLRETNGIAVTELIGNMRAEYRETVVGRALDHRARASGSVRDSLNAAIRNHVKIDRFRDSSKAPAPMLKETVVAQTLMGGKDKLAGALLRAWTESQPDLRELVTEHLKREGIETQPPDFREGVFGLQWTTGEWLERRELIAGEREGLDEDDVALMLCCVSGGAPPPDGDANAPPLLSDLFSKWLNELRKLPLEAIEWKEREDFAKAIERAHQSKTVDMLEEKAAALDAILNEITELFSSDLGYLDIDISNWGIEARRRVQLFGDSGEIAKALHHLLAEYHEARPQAPSRKEEMIRAERRQRIEADIFDTVENWNELIESSPVDLLSDERPANEPAPNDGGIMTRREYESLISRLEIANRTYKETREEHDRTLTMLARVKRQNERSISEMDEKDERIARLSAEVEAVKRDGETLGARLVELNLAAEHAEADKAELAEQSGELREQLAQSLEMQEYWRRMYVEQLARNAGAGKAEIAPPNSVNAAIDAATAAFPDRLAFALNSKSSKNCPFQRPDEVYDAFAWLATEYYNLRANPGGSPDFNKLIKQACSGWSYKSGQTEVTREQFIEWYVATLNGRRYYLDTHIGKGNRFDPQKTIRIAFAWDDELRKVVVGFIGMHQRNRRS